MGTKQGYAITTWRLRLRCKHPEWLETTQNFYNEIQKFYYWKRNNHVPEYLFSNIVITQIMRSSPEVTENSK